MDKQIQDSKNKDMREKKQADGAEEQAEDHKAKRRLVKNIPLLIAEICMLVAAVVILYVVVTATDEVERRPIDKGRIIINKEVKQTQKKKKEEAIVAKEKQAAEGLQRVPQHCAVRCGCQRRAAGKRHQK